MTNLKTMILAAIGHASTTNGKPDECLKIAEDLEKVLAERHAYGKLVKALMDDLEEFGGMAAHVQTNFKDKDGKEWTVRVYEGEPDD